MNRKKRTYNTRRIKRWYSYSIQEIAELFGVHKNSIRQWRKQGLKTIDDARPCLIHGSDLIDFLRTRQQNRKQRCQPGEFYCCKCRTPRRSYEGIADIRIINTKLLNLVGLCDHCSTSLYKSLATENIAQALKTFTIQTVSPPHLIAQLPHSVKCALQKENLI